MNTLSMTPAELAERTNPADYEDIRKEMRAFYPDECHGDCKDPGIPEAYLEMTRSLDDFLRKDPDAPIFRVKKQYYETLPKYFHPVLFRNLPFYFEAGMNGGWCRHNPGRAWFERNFNRRIDEVIPEEKRKVFSARNRQRYMLCCGYFIDAIHHIPPLTAILTRGFGGVREDTLKATERCRTPEERDWIDAALAGLDAVHAVQLKFAAEAESILKREPLTDNQRRNLRRIAESAKVVPWAPPRTFYEGLNTFWFVREILGLTDGLAVYSIGHPDDMLRSLYEADLAAGRITPEEAFDLICCFLLVADCHHNGMIPVSAYDDHEMEIPLTLGGCDGSGKEVFNDLTRMFILAHRRLDLVFPKLHCRCSEKSSPEYLRMLAEDVYRGRCVHDIFNDDITIPTLEAAGKTPEDARRYLCNGCWDAGAESKENRYGADYFSLARILEATIYRDPEKEREAGIHLTPLDGAESFAEVRKIMLGNITKFAADVLDDYTAYETASVLAYPHPLYSACLDGCLEKLRDESVGGAEYSSRDLDMAFFGNLTDSLLAIDAICFKQKACTVAELLDAVRANWKTRPDLRKMALAAPHWGDDTPESTALAREIQQAMYEVVHARKNGRGGPYVLCSWIYREYKYWGEQTRALPDGRRDGDYLAQALNPSSFRTKEDITTVLNAIGRLDHLKFDSSNVNLTFEKGNVSVEALVAVFRTFCHLKMHVLQPNCFSRAELLEAQKHPEQHRNLIVKVCGFSARFVALSPQWQQAVLDRCFF